MRFYAFTGHDGSHHQSPGVSGIISRARSYAKRHNFRPAIRELTWNAKWEVWESKERPDLTDRAYLERRDAA